MRHNRDNSTAVIYCRVSTEHQVVDGVSLAAQEADIRSYCGRRGLTVAAVIIDAGVSGKIPIEDRPGGAELAATLRRRKDPVGHVVAMKLDRLFRNLADCSATTEQWDKGGVALHLVDLGGQTVDTSTAIGRFFLDIMASVAVLERGMISERIKTAMKHKRSTGRRTSLHAPFGYSIAADGDTLESVASEQATIARARELRYVCGYSIRKVAKKLTEEGHRPRGKAWHATTVVRIMKRIEELEDNAA